MSWGKLDPFAPIRGPVRRPVRRRATAAAAAIAAFGALTSTAAATATTTTAATETSARPALTYNACTRNVQFAAANPVSAILADRYQWATYPATTVGDGTGNIDWTLNPYRRVSWAMWLHSLRWVGSALDAAARGNQEATEHLMAIVRDWAADNPYPWNGTPTAQEATMHRTNVLLCLRTVLANRNDGTLPEDAGWLDALIVTHARSLEAYFSGFGNHGTDESLAMLGVGCLLGHPYYRDLAGRRLLEILDHAIYPDGSVNEQSTGYAAFNYSLWNRARVVVEQCTPESSLARTIEARLSALALFLAHAMTPQGTFHQLGDTEDVRRPALLGTPQEYPATAGASGTPPTQRVAVYRSGYVFGRSGWGGPDRPFPATSAYSIRFGAKQRYHGHSDHMSVTYQARGLPVLIDPGYGEYTQDAWQAFSKGPTAHNQLVVPGMTTARATALTRSRVGAGHPNADYFQLRDAPGTGMARVRDVLVLHDPDLMLVADRASTKRPGTFQQLWHLPPRTTVKTGRYAAVTHTTAASPNDAASTTAAVSTTFLRLPYRTARVLPATPQVLSGRTRPVQGWWWPTIFTRQQAPVVSMAQRGTSVTMLTAVVPAAPGTRVAVAAAPTRNRKTWVYTFTLTPPRAPDPGTATAPRVVQVAIAADGSMTRLR